MSLTHLVRLYHLIAKQKSLILSFFKLRGLLVLKLSGFFKLNLTQLHQYFCISVSASWSVVTKWSRSVTSVPAKLGEASDPPAWVSPARWPGWHRRWSGTNPATRRSTSGRSGSASGNSSIVKCRTGWDYTYVFNKVAAGFAWYFICFSLPFYQKYWAFQN